MRRDGGAAPVRWFDIDPCYVFHVVNAHEDAAGRIVLDAVRYDPASFQNTWRHMRGARRPGVPGTAAPGSAKVPGAARLHRWVLDPESGTAREEPLDDRGVEFPTLNDAYIGRPARFRYAAVNDAIVKYDTLTGASRTYGAGQGNAPREAVFVPAGPAAGEDEGWLLSIVSDGAGAGCELLVLDARDLSRVAAVRLPRRVPAGFHGSWIADRPSP